MTDAKLSKDKDKDWGPNLGYMLDLEASLLALIMTQISLVGLYSEWFIGT